MSESTIILEKDGKIATVYLNRPKSLNAFTSEMSSELLSVLDAIKKDQEVNVVIITGKGKHFCAGGDLQTLNSVAGVIAARNLIGTGGEIVSAIMNLEKPVIAMVNGVAAGAGFSFALACDFIYCSKSASFTQSFTKIGLVPDMCSMFLLPRIVGLHKSKELMFLADPIASDEALKIGIVNTVVEDDDLVQKTYEFAGKIANAAPIAIGMIKRIVNQSINHNLESLLEIEKDLQALCMQTMDHKEGINAFLQKRKPVFRGE